MKVTIELACLKKKENQSAHFASAWLVLSRWFFTTLVPAKPTGANLGCQLILNTF